MAGNTNDIIEVARGISEYGVLAVIAAFFLVFAAGVMAWNMTSYRKIVEKIFGDFGKKLDRVQETLEDDLEMTADIAERSIPETQLRIRNTAGAFFDLSAERVCRLIVRLRRENNIKDREAEERKIRSLLKNLHEDRNSRFGSYHYKGRALSEYTNPEWEEWVLKAVLEELYSKDGANDERAFTNISAVYDNIKLDFYHRMGI